MLNHYRPGIPATSRAVVTISTIAGLILALVSLAGSGGEAFAASPKQAAKQQKVAVHLQPSSAAPGATLSIVGSGFGTFQSTKVNRVLFGGVPALIQRWDPSLIEVKVPYEAKNGPVEIQKGKQRIAAGTFTVQRPVIREVVPAEAEPGNVVQLLGEHFGPTAGPRDPNSMFGVNDVVIGGVVVRPRRWRDDKIEVEVPANAASGDIHIRLASSDPLPDGSCCATVQHVLSNSVRISLMPTVRVDPVSGPIGTKVVSTDRTLEPTFWLKLQRGDAVEEVAIPKASGEVYELADEVAAVVRAVRDGTPVPCSGEDGWWSTAMCLKAAESISTGAPVQLTGPS